jgi:hypothetical protein
MRLALLFLLSCSSPAQTADATTDATNDATQDATPDGATDGGSDGSAPLVLADFQIGTYGSANALFLSILDYGLKYDLAKDYTLLGGEAYEIQAAATFLRAGRGRDLPGGEAERLHVADTALKIAANAIAYDGLVKPIADAPGWGRPDAWDAFSDNTQNPPFTNYAWDTGLTVRALVDLGVAILADPKLATYAAQAQSILASARTILDVWEKKGWSDLSAIQHSEWGFYWYSLALDPQTMKPYDAIPVFNTTGLLSMAETVYGEWSNSSTWASRSKAAFGYLDASLLYAQTTDSYAWHYAGWNYPHPQVFEDISHASQTEQWLRFGLERGFLSPMDAARIQRTLADVIYKGNPARLASAVDGTSDANDWTYTPPAAMGIAVWGDAVPNGRVELWELARDVYFSAQLEGNDRSQANPIVSAYDALTIANLFLHRPSALAPDSKWTMHAGDPNDNVAPQNASGGVRFHPSDWSAPATFSDAALPNIPKPSVRTSTAPNANFFVDLPAASDVLVSIVYRSATAGSVLQWDGAKYVTLAPLPATTVPQQTVPVFFRTTFRLDKSTFDYQPQVPGTNVLLEVTPSAIAIATIEATPL